MKLLMIVALILSVSILVRGSELSKTYPSGNKRLMTEGLVVGVRLLQQVGDKKVNTNKFESADIVQVIGQGKNESTWFYCRVGRDLIESKGMTVKEFVTHLNGQSTLLQCEEYEVGGFSADDFKMSVFGVSVLNKKL